MEIILVSWIATLNDFYEKNAMGEMVKTDDRINRNGPHYNLYKHFPNFDKHVLLCQSDSENNAKTEWSHLKTTLGNDFKKPIEFAFLNITDPTNVGQIKCKVEDYFHKNLVGKNIEVFINPGSPAMQTAWYLLGLHSNYFSKVNLFKVTEAKFNNDGQPKKEIISFHGSNLAINANILEIEQNSNKNIKPFTTKSTEEVYNLAKELATNNASSIVILGETGTGKEILAKEIHNNSNRSKKPLISLNCGAFNDELLESRLFGYEKGAFTNALNTTKGAFEEAHGGTLFLDEIGDMSKKMQTTLLRVLQEKKISRIGSVEEIPVDVRIITASHKNLWEMCNKDEFRIDLYYRLAIVDLELPPFKNFERKEKELWVNYFLEKKNVTHNERHLTLSKEVKDFIFTHSFPGNIRELENLIDKFYLTVKGREVGLVDLPKRYIHFKENDSLKLEDVKRKHIQNVLKLCDGNKTQASNILGITRQMIDTYIK